jgi:divalent metal cation (Fe/Co/Zn/Cd) transporter
VSRCPLVAALWVSYAAVCWSVLAGSASVAVGIQSRSTALVGTGADVLADMLSSLVLIWRFRGELQRRHPSDAVERRAHRVSSIALIIVAVGIAATGAVRLVSGGGASADSAATIAAAVSLVVLPVFAIAKYRIASTIPSAALRMDGHITFVGATMAAITLVGLALTAMLGWSAADSIAALGVALVAAATGLQGLRETTSPT